jgi:SET domain-containing protein
MELEATWRCRQCRGPRLADHMDNSKLEVRPSPLGGEGVFAKERIEPDELIAEWDGEIYPFEHPGWTEDLLSHVIQFERARFRDALGLARRINHSCEANSGIKELFRVVAMRPIEPGEEVTWDYEMTEDSEWWRMRCLCGTPSCRKLIGAYRNMPAEVRARYRGYISEWLTQEEEGVAAAVR